MSAAVLRTVTTEQGEIVYDSDMPIGSLKGVLGAANDGDLDGIIVGLSAFVVSWPFEGDPAKAEDWNALRRSEFNALIVSVMEDLGKLGEE